MKPQRESETEGREGRKEGIRRGEKQLSSKMTKDSKKSPDAFVVEALMYCVLSAKLETQVCLCLKDPGLLGFRCLGKHLGNVTRLGS